MKKVIRLTESDLVRIVKRVISEQKPGDELFPEDDQFFVNKFKNDVKSLHDQISMVRKENFRNKKEELKATLISKKNEIMSTINRIIDKIKGKVDEKQIKYLEERANLLNKKLEELKKTGKVFTDEERELIVKEMISILGFIVGLRLLPKLNLPNISNLPNLPMP